MHKLLESLPPGARVLDLGARTGSFSTNREDLAIVRLDLERLSAYSERWGLRRSREVLQVCFRKTDPGKLWLSPPGIAWPHSSQVCTGGGSVMALKAPRIGKILFGISTAYKDRSGRDFLTP